MESRSDPRFLNEPPSVPDPSFVRKRIIPIIEKKLGVKFPNL